MTLPATPRQAGPFNGNGVTTSFPFTFKVWAASDLRVVVTTAGVDSVKVIGSDYTVTLNPDQNTTPGGTINYPATVPVGSILRIWGNMSVEQPTDLPDGGDYRAEQVESMSDRIVAILQEHIGGEASSWAYALPNPQADWLIGWNGTGTALENKDPSLIVGGGEFFDTELQTATAGQTLFTLATVLYTPGQNNIAVYVNGIRMVGNGQDYIELSATEVSFVDALADGDQVYFVGGQDVGGGGGGGSGLPPAGGVNFSNFTMLPVSAGGPISRRWEYASTNPAGWNTGAGSMTFDAEFVMNDYFAANPNAHWGIALRCDTAMIAVQARFAGVIFGNVVGVQEGAPHAPAAQLETRATGLDPGGALRFLLPNSWTPPGKLLDGATYRIVVTSTVAANNKRYIRYQLWQKNTAHSETGFAGDMVFDSGDMLDPNQWLDYTKSGLVFFSVFESNLVPWSIAFTTPNVTWYMPNTPTTDTSVKVNRYDAEVEGNFTFVGNSRRFYLYNDSSLINWTEWTQFKTRVVNSNTTMLLVPNGTSTAANIMATNQSNMALPYGCTTLGMNGARSELTTYGVGAAHPEMDVKIGSTTVSSFLGTGQILYGNWTISGTSRRIYTWNDSTGIAFDQWTRFVTTKVNGNTTVLAAPNGSSTASNFMACNNSVLSGAFGSVALGMIGARASILSYTVGGGAHPEIDFTIGLGTVATLKTTGLWMAGAIEAIGANSTRVIVTNPGGANALALSQASLDLETYSTVGYIQGLLTDAGWTAGMKGDVETAVRPIIALVSALIADKQARKE